MLGDSVATYKYDLSGCTSSTMAFNLDQLTDKARETVQAAIQLATDYANSQCTSFHPFTPSSAHIYAVYPVHLAFVLLNEGAGDGPTGNISQSQIPLFASVIQKAGGDVVSPFPITSYPCVFTSPRPK